MICWYYVLWAHREIHPAAPRAITCRVPSLDPPGVVAAAKCDNRCNRTSRTTAHSGGLIPLLDHVPGRTIHPQVVPGRGVTLRAVQYRIPGVGGSRIRDASRRRDERCCNRWLWNRKTEAHAITPGAITRVAPGLGGVDIPLLFC